MSEENKWPPISMQERVDAHSYRRLNGSCHSMPCPSERSVDDAVQDALRRKKDLPHVVQVYPRDWDTCILAEALDTTETKRLTLERDLAEARGNYERMHADKMRLLNEAIDLRAQVEALTNDAEAHRSYKQAMNLAKRAIEALTAERDAVLARWHEPVSPGALQRLGERLSRILSEDDWNNIEPFLLPLEAQLSRLLADNGRLRSSLTSARTELYSATVQMAASDDQIICNTVRKALHIVSTALEDQ